MVYPLVSSHQPVLIFGGAYSNRQATSAMLDRMIEEGLPQGYAEALRTGLWPSLDVLPEPEQLATGKPLRLVGNHFQFRRGY